MQQVARRLGRALVLLVAAGVGSACASEGDPSWSDGRCNGAAALCERRYDEVSYPTTHNAMSNAANAWVAPNQNFGLTRQLADGVRGLMLDVYSYEGLPQLCHGSCLLGNQPLADGLTEVSSFLRANPGEVVTLIFESYIVAAAMTEAFEAADLTRFTHVQVKGAPWPTLRTLIESGRRLVVFSDDDFDGALPWLHDVWAFAWETHYSAMTLADFSCAKNRGDAANTLFIFNHFLGRPLPDPTLAEEANPAGVLGARTAQCKNESGRLPNFVTVDFHDIGDLFTVVDGLNGVTSAAPAP